MSIKNTLEPQEVVANSESARRVSTHQCPLTTSREDENQLQAILNNQNCATSSLICKQFIGQQLEDKQSSSQGMEDAQRKSEAGVPQSGSDSWQEDEDEEDEEFEDDVDAEESSGQEGVSENCETKDSSSIQDLLSKSLTRFREQANALQEAIGVMERLRNTMSDNSLIGRDEAQLRNVLTSRTRAIDSYQVQSLIAQMEECRSAHGFKSLCEQLRKLSIAEDNIFQINETASVPPEPNQPEQHQVKQQQQQQQQFNAQPQLQEELQKKKTAGAKHGARKRVRASQISMEQENEESPESNVNAQARKREKLMRKKTPTPPALSQQIEQEFFAFSEEELASDKTLLTTGTVSFARSQKPIPFQLHSKEDAAKVRQFLALTDESNHQLRCQHFQHNMSQKVLKTIQARFTVLQRQELLWLKGIIKPVDDRSAREFEEFIARIELNEQMIKIKQKHAAVYLTTLNQIKKYLPQIQISADTKCCIAYMFYGEIDLLKSEKENITRNVNERLQAQQRIVAEGEGINLPLPSLNDSVVGAVSQQALPITPQEEEAQLQTPQRQQCPNTPVFNKKRKYTSYNIKNQLTLQQKLEAVYLAEQSKNKSKTARLFGVDRNSVANWVKKKKLLESIPEELRRKRMKQIEGALIETTAQTEGSILVQQSQPIQSQKQQVINKIEEDQKPLKLLHSDLNCPHTSEKKQAKKHRKSEELRLLQQDENSEDLQQQQQQQDQQQQQQQQQHSSAACITTVVEETEDSASSSHPQTDKMLKTEASNSVLVQPAYPIIAPDHVARIFPVEIRKSSADYEQLKDERKKHTQSLLNPQNNLYMSMFLEGLIKNKFV